MGVTTYAPEDEGTCSVPPGKFKFKLTLDTILVVMAIVGQFWFLGERIGRDESDIKVLKEKVEKQEILLSHVATLFEKINGLQTTDNLVLEKLRSIEDKIWAVHSNGLNGKDTKK